MKEDDDMLTIARPPRDEATPADTIAVELSTIPTEALARLDRLATASVLASGLAHEIANPLSCLIGALDALERRLRDLRRSPESGDLDDVAAELELASASTGAITDLVHDFQRFLRQDQPLGVPSASVKDAVQRALRIMGPRLHAIARVDVQLREVPAVRAPTGRVVQVVMNLLLNATEALAHRDKAQNLVAVRLDVAAGRVLVEVSDNGPGLPASIRDRIFEPGVSLKHGRAGTGLGLSIARELVHKMNGEISVSSLPGAGTTFLVSLPAS
jgi:signal transduction histidine kinase